MKILSILRILKCDLPNLYSRYPYSIIAKKMVPWQPIMKNPMGPKPPMGGETAIVLL